LLDKVGNGTSAPEWDNIRSFRSAPGEDLGLVVLLRLFDRNARARKARKPGQSGPMPQAGILLL
jgi:hypothetical protein